MKTVNKLLPETWCKLVNLLVLDPDGWDRANFEKDWAKKLSYVEFCNKSSFSTTQWLDKKYKHLDYNGLLISYLFDCASNLNRKGYVITGRLYDHKFKYCVVDEFLMMTNDPDDKVPVIRIDSIDELRGILKYIGVV